jgi:hypothetical protein
MKLRDRMTGLRYRLWWKWWAFRIGSDALKAAGYQPPSDLAVKRRVS